MLQEPRTSTSTMQKKKKPTSKKKKKTPLLTPVPSINHNTFSMDLLLHFVTPVTDVNQKTNLRGPLVLMLNSYLQTSNFCN